MIERSLSSLSQALAAKEISSVELTQLYLERIARLNPALTGKRGGMRVLAPALPDTGGSPETLPAATTASTDIANADTGTATQASAGIRRHTVCSGESAWSIARRYGIPVKTLLARNNLDAKAVLKPGMVLRFDEPR